MEEIDYLCVWAWKRRTGFIGGYGAAISGQFAGRIKKWEHRSLVVCDTTLSYYETGTEDSEKPRGSLDLLEGNVTISMEKPESDAPSPYQVIIASTEQKLEWKFCFDEQPDLMRLVAVMNNILDKAGKFKQLDYTRFEHQFQAGDHIYKWEMLVYPPVIYPIQIHGIVLEAGSNCIIVADFGLTGYSRKNGQEFHHADQDDHNFRVMSAFRKLRPNDVTQRIHIVTLTDQKEIRKWFKAGYDEESLLARAKKSTGGHHLDLTKVTKVFAKIKTKGGGTKKEDLEQGESIQGSDSKEETTLTTTDAENTNDGTESGPGNTSPTASAEKIRESISKGSKAAAKTMSRGTKAVSTLFKRSTSKSTGVDNDDNDISESHTEEEPTNEEEDKLKKLPQADPKEIVLARANFVLEHMEVLPSYHVFFSNSECIAVWCKTGRWSTLQTSVWCSTNSVAAFKSSAITTIGVAAANPLLAPVIAIGGLVWVSAPMVLLQKSQVKWEEATEKMTRLFWEWAPPVVYVSAVENWTTVLQQKEIDGDSSKENETADETKSKPKEGV